MQQGSFQEMMSPDHDLYSEAGISRDLYERLKLAGKLQDDEVEAAGEVAEEEEEEEEEEFSFMFGGENTSIAAEDVFMNGEIKPVFPLFNRDLLFSGDGDGDSDLDSLPENLPMRLPVDRVFVETNETGQVMSSTPENDEIAGPYCEWSSGKAVARPAEVCKKSNSTGFSKIWRIKEFVGRCNSDGRDAFVFLNNSHAPPPAAAKKAEEKSEKKETTTAVKINTVKKSDKSKTAPLSAHEVYLRSKAKEEFRRRSYLPYRPELMGFFTNVNGGLTKNVHPY